MPDWNALIMGKAQPKAQERTHAPKTPVERVSSAGMQEYTDNRKTRSQAILKPYTQRAAFRAAFDFMERHLPTPARLQGGPARYWQEVGDDLEQTRQPWRGNELAEDLFVAVYDELERTYNKAASGRAQ